MIGWIYSDPVRIGFDRAVTTSDQKNQRRPKRSWTLLIASETSVRLCVTILWSLVTLWFYFCRFYICSWSFTTVTYSRFCRGLKFVAILKNQPKFSSGGRRAPQCASPLDNPLQVSGASGRRREARGTCLAPRGFSNCIKSSHTMLLTTLKRLEVTRTVLVRCENFWYNVLTPVQNPATE